MEISRLLVLEPRPLWWEQGGVLNPAVAEVGGRIYMLYRAVGLDRISRFGLAVSVDGREFTRFDQPIFEGSERNPYHRLGVEDPRVARIGRDYYITYTGASVYPVREQHQGARSLNTPGVPWRIRTMALRTRDFRSFDDLGVWLDFDSKDSTLFPEKINGHYWLLHRIDPSIFVSTSRNLKGWDGGFRLLTPVEDWESQKIGSACPPILTDKGWLLFYHAVDSRKRYSVGAVLLDRQNPAIVRARSKTPLMEPTQTWEKHGLVGNVVFVTGLIVRDHELWLYYGGGDRVVGLAKINLDAVFKHLEVTGTYQPLSVTTG